jgi:16S rRNA processing protein RimM
VTNQETASVAVARIVRTHGLRGEVAAEILTDFPEHLEELPSVELWSERSGSRRVALRGCRFTTSRGGQAILHFEGADSQPDAQKLVGCEVRIARSERMALPESSYYIADLIGCEVHERASAVNRGALLGSVADVDFSGGTPLLVVKGASGELLIPLAQDICVNVDLAARRIEVVLPEGLRELNQK